MCSSISGKNPAMSQKAIVIVIWPGGRARGKSTAGGIVMLGSQLVKSWSRTQDSVTLSSAEAELVALGKLAIARRSQYVPRVGTGRGRKD